MTPQTLEKQPLWQSEALKKLDDLSKLGHNWNSYGGQPLRPEIRDFAVDLLGWLDGGLPAAGVVLGSGGTVQFEWRIGGRELEIEVLTSGSVGFLKVDLDGQMEEGEVSQDFLHALGHLTEWLLGSARQVAMASTT